MAPHALINDGLSGKSGQQPVIPALLTWLERMTQKLLASWAWYDTYRQTARELNQLTEKELDDIGIPRHDIPRIALQAANTAQARR